MTDLDKYEVIVVNGKQYLTYEGKILSNQTEIKIEQDVTLAQKGLCEATVTVFAKMKDTK